VVVTSLKGRSPSGLDSCNSPRRVIDSREKMRSHTLRGDRRRTRAFPLPPAPDASACAMAFGAGADSVTDEELVHWLGSAQVVIVGRQQTLDLERPSASAPVEEAFDVLAQTYDPCRAPRWDLCLYCPWELCRRPAAVSGHAEPR